MEMTPAIPPAAPGGRAWRAEQRDAVLRFAARSALPDGGFGWLDAAGDIDPTRDLELWLNARMTYVFSLASLLDGSVHPLAEHGVRTLHALFADPRYGGWYRSVRSDGTPVETTKGCYEHAFMVLAGSTAHVAGVPDADPLLEDALATHARHFWDEPAGRCRESWNADWTQLEPYRGVNSNMHTVEAYLFAADATGDPIWRRRALSICDHLMNDAARRNGWRIPEHFDAAWRVDLDYNADAPADPFRPYGATPGHGFEWARLLLDVEASLDDPPEWLLEAATALFTTAARDGAPVADGTLVYTTDWSGRPVVRERFHWVLAEAVAAADALARRTGDAIGVEEAGRWWAAIDEHFVDRSAGSWHHELGDDLHVSSRTWSGKPDAYHIVNAMLLPDLPLAPCLATALAAA
jgi:mannose/cellobiose epimerase-like protein (N-acyl-D-glucosamine 2-epimerase family)